MLGLTMARAELQDGHHILELGCGWGSLTLWMVNVGVQWKLFDGSIRHSSDAITRQAISLKEQRDDLRIVSQINNFQLTTASIQQ